MLHHLRGHFRRELTTIIRLDCQGWAKRLDSILQEDLTSLFSVTSSVRASLGKFGEVVNDHQPTKISKFSFCKL